MLAMSIFVFRYVTVGVLLGAAFVSDIEARSFSQKAKQPREVVEAYRVCERFQRLLAEDLDFDRAFEATFTRNPARRRKIAIAELQFVNIDLARVDDASLISAYKSRMQMFYLVLPLVSLFYEEDESQFFPPEIMAIFERKPPREPHDFPSFAIQLKQDAANVRSYLDQLAAKDPAISEQIRKFKIDLSRKIELPNHAVEPLTAYSRGHVLGLRHPYYRVGDYAVIRERRRMRIIGIQFFGFFRPC
jgi:hypothetical protein